MKAHAYRKAINYAYSRVADINAFKRVLVDLEIIDRGNGECRSALMERQPSAWAQLSKSPTNESKRPHHPRAR